MNCKALLLYAQGELAPVQAREFKNHLQTCKKCQHELAFLNQVSGALIPPAAPSKTVEALLAKTTRKQPFWSRTKTIWAGVMAAVLVGLVFLPYPDKQPTLNNEVLAYLSENLDADYQTFASDLAEFENEF